MGDGDFAGVVTRGLCCDAESVLLTGGAAGLPLPLLLSLGNWPKFICARPPADIGPPFGAYPDGALMVTDGFLLWSEDTELPLGAPLFAAD